MTLINYVGVDAIENVRAAFRSEGFGFSDDGMLLPVDDARAFARACEIPGVAPGYAPRRKSGVSSHV